MRLKDHYKTLGVQPAVEQAVIKKAYRALAFQYHPDTNPENAFAEARFKEIQEAYSVLSHPNKRKAYDEERWLSGMSNRVNDQRAITPAYILHESRKLEKYIATIDTFRMSHRSLRDYIFLLLSDSHIGVLKKESDTDTNYYIITTLTNATKRIELEYAKEIAERLYQLSDGRENSNTVIVQYLSAHKKRVSWEKALPFIAITITLFLCIIMWLYAKK